MKKRVIVILLVGLFLGGCFADKPNEKLEQGLSSQTKSLGKTRVKSTGLKSNHNGTVMILMYHKFSDKETDNWTRSFENFEKDLNELYSKGYRPISMKEYIDGNINLPEGYSPIIFTFDDGTAGQFNMIKKDGKLTVNPNSAVCIMEAFNKKHNDFDLKGTFFINHTGYFGQVGTSAQKLKYLVDKGFDIGNHTMTHVNLAKADSPQTVQAEIGGHVRKTAELLPGYNVDVVALPLGITSKKYRQYVTAGEYMGTKYNNRAILLVGSNPAPSHLDKNRSLFKLPRIKAIGSEPEEYDMRFWLDYFDKHPEKRYVQ